MLHLPLVVYVDALDADDERKVLDQRVITACNLTRREVMAVVVLADRDWSRRH